MGRWRTPPGEVERLFEAWRSRMERPSLVKLTAARKGKIRRALRRYPVEDLEMLVRFAFEAEHERAEFWRHGMNGPLSIDFLLQATKLDERIEMARIYYAEEEEEPESWTGVSYPGSQLPDPDEPVQQVVTGSRRRW